MVKRPPLTQVVFRPRLTQGRIFGPAGLFLVQKKMRALFAGESLTASLIIVRKKQGKKEKKEKGGDAIDGDNVPLLHR